MIARMYEDKKEEVGQAWRSFAAGSREARGWLAAHYAPYVKVNAKKFVKAVGLRDDAMADLVGEGMLCLLRSLDCYLLDAHVHFLAYFKRGLYRAFSKATEKNTRFGRIGKLEAKDYDETVCPKPRPDEVAGDADDRSYTSRLVKIALDAMSEREREYCKRHFFKGQILKEIATTQSHQAVQQCIKRGLSKARARLIEVGAA